MVFMALQWVGKMATVVVDPVSVSHDVAGTMVSRDFSPKASYIENQTPHALMDRDDLCRVPLYVATGLHQSQGG